MPLKSLPNMIDYLLSIAKGGEAMMKIRAEFLSLAHLSLSLSKKIWEHAQVTFHKNSQSIFIEGSRKSIGQQTPRPPEVVPGPWYHSARTTWHLSTQYLFRTLLTPVRGLPPCNRALRSVAPVLDMGTEHHEQLSLGRITPKG